MSLDIRRVVTGHDDQGRARVLIDETVKNVASQRPGALYSVIWSSEAFQSTMTATRIPPARRSVRRFPMEPSFVLSALARGWHRATIAPIRSTTLW